MGTGIHLNLEQSGYPHLTFQNGKTGLTLAHEMPSATGTLLQHLQTNLVFQRENQLLITGRLPGIVTVYIVEEIAADAMTACQSAIHMAQVISQLQQIGLGRRVALTRFLEVGEVLIRITELQQLFAVGNWGGALAPPDFSYSINHDFFKN